MPARILAGPLKGPTQKYTSWTSFTSFYQQILNFSIFFSWFNIFCAWFNIFSINYHYCLFTVKSSYVLLRLGYVALKILKISFLWTNEGVFAKKPGAFSIIFGNPPLISAHYRPLSLTACRPSASPEATRRDFPDSPSDKQLPIVMPSRGIRDLSLCYYVTLFVLLSSYNYACKVWVCGHSTSSAIQTAQAHMRT